MARISEVAGLVPAGIGDRPDLREEAGMVAVHGELSPIEPLDLPVASGSDRETLGVGGNPEPQWTRECAELLKCGWYALGHRASLSNS
jgi:hypothetical protein